VVSATFQLLYVFVILDIGTRRVVHWNLTEHPTVEWTIRQFRHGLPLDGASRFLVHDRVASLRRPWTRPFGRRASRRIDIAVRRRPDIAYQPLVASCPARISAACITTTSRNQSRFEFLRSTGAMIGL